jgi:hypothetical protein
MSVSMALGQHLDRLMDALQISEHELAQVVGASPRSVARWRAEGTYPQHEARRRLDSLDALVRRLDESFKTPEGAMLWLRAESGYFGGLRPLDALLRGRMDAVDAALEALDSGVFV